MHAMRGIGVCSIEVFTTCFIRVLVIELAVKCVGTHIFTFLKHLVNTTAEK